MGPPGVQDMSRGRPRVWAVAAVSVMVVAAVLRLAALDHPPRTYFDEVYYAEDALAVAEQGVEERRPSHPPLGPALISVGISIGGGDPWAWRLMPALAGTGVVLFTGLAARRLGATAPTSIAAMLLVALDGLSLTMSRIAMLDVFVAFFVLAGFWLLLGGLERGPGSSGWLGWMSAAGASFGLAAAVKWSGLLALAAALFVAVGQTMAWLWQRRPAAGSVGKALAGGMVALAVVPAAAYIASYTGWFLNFEQTAAAEERCQASDCSVGLVQRSAVWWEEQVELVDYHQRLPATHPYRSPAWSWPLLLRPVLYYFEECPVEEGECRVDPGQEAKILGLGNPALWWASIPLGLAIGWAALVRRHRWALIVGAFWLAQYIPWFLTGKEGYLFYMTPLVPFLAIGVGMAWRQFGRWSPFGVGLVSTLSVVAFIYFAPIWYGLPMAEEAVDARMWLHSWR